MSNVIDRGKNSLYGRVCFSQVAAVTLTFALVLLVQ